MEKIGSQKNGENLTSEKNSPFTLYPLAPEKPLLSKEKK
jgi:hypothetical protein